MFFEKHGQNLNAPQNNSACWDLQMGFNLAFKGLMHALFRSYNGGHTDVHYPVVLFLQEPKSETPFCYITGKV